MILQEEQYLKEISYKIDVLEVRILECIYQNDVYVFPYLTRKLKSRFNIKESKRTIYRRLRQLERLGLIKVLKRTSPLCFKLLDKNLIIKLILISKDNYKLV